MLISTPELPVEKAVLVRTKQRISEIKLYILVISQRFSSEAQVNTLSPEGGLTLAQRSAGTFQTCMSISRYS